MLWNGAPVFQQTCDDPFSAYPVLTGHMVYYVIIRVIHVISQHISTFRELATEDGNDIYGGLNWE